MENGSLLFHNIFKYMIFQRRQKALFWSKGLMKIRCTFFAVSFTKAAESDMGRCSTPVSMVISTTSVFTLTLAGSET